MRPAAIALLLFALALPMLAPATPTVTETDAVEAVHQLVSSVGGYSARHPGTPGGCDAWTDSEVVPGTPLLVHSYPALEPSYYYVPLTSRPSGSRTFVTVDAVSRQWLAFGPAPDDLAFPRVSRADAARLAASTLGTPVSPDVLRAVSMPNKHIYWYWSDGSRTAPSRELFINVGDASEVHTAPDEEIAPPERQLGVPHDRAAPTDVRPTGPGVCPPRDDERGERFPPAYNITGVPHHYQGTSYNCGPAASEVVLDYYGPDIYQEDIADVANCVNPGGSYATDIRRTGHFSAISSAVQDTSLHGYDERKLGYGALDCWWSNPDSSDPDYPDRYNDLKELVSSDFPVLLLMWYDTSHNSGHFRVVKGYNDSTNVFIAHDPWYSPPYQGPNVNFNQVTFVDNLWTKWYRWGTLICPWDVQITAPDEVDFGETFTVQAVIYYLGPHPFEDQDPASSREVTIDPSPLFSLAPGETATKTLPGSVTSGLVGNLVTWDLVAPSVELGNIVTVTARGLISDSAHSYPSYSDSIGGWDSHPITVVNQSGVDGSVPTALSLSPPRPSPFDGSTLLALAVPPDAGHVSLAVYNAGGQRVRTLTDGVLPPGRREFVWKGDDDTGAPVAAGVYFARCESEAGTSVQKVVLLR